MDFMHHCVRNKFKDGRTRALLRTTVDVCAIDFMHHCVRNKFKDGRTLNGTIDDIVNDRIDALSHKAFVLNVCSLPGQELFTFDNRRLYCLKEAAKKNNRILKVHVVEQLTRHWL